MLGTGGCARDGDFLGVREQLSGGKKSHICQLRCDGDFRCLVLYSETWRLEVSICTISKPASCIIEIFRFRCGHSGIKRMLRWRRRRPMLFFLSGYSCSLIDALGHRVEAVTQGQTLGNRSYGIV